MLVSYFDQPQHWRKTLDPYQVQTRADVLDLLPSDVRSVLDVGCGDGVITNALPEHLTVVGIDWSQEALKSVTRPSAVGSITDLPFPDQAFDLVMANDLLEHIPDALLPVALAELRRVARKYILITVPYNEDLRAHQTRCTNCKTVYHVNGHQRSISQAFMRTLFERSPALVELRLSGHITQPAHDPTVDVRHALGIFHHWSLAICPVCGAQDATESEADARLKQVLDLVRAEQWSAHLEQGGYWNNRTEIIGLYAVNDFPQPEPQSDLELIEQSLLRIDFRNPLQIANPDFTAGFFGSQFQLTSAVEMTPLGVVAAAASSSIPMVTLTFPVTPHAGDVIEVEALTTSEAHVRLYVVKNQREYLLGTLHFEPSAAKARYTIDRSWLSEPLGFVIRAYPDAYLTLQAVEYMRGNEQLPVVPFVTLHPGHNVIRRTTNGYSLSWGMYTNTGGMLPYITDDIAPLSELATDFDLYRVLRRLADELLDLQGVQLERDNLRQQVTAQENALYNVQHQLAAKESTFNQLVEQHKLAQAKIDDLTGIRNAVREIRRSIVKRLRGTP